MKLKKLLPIAAVASTAAVVAPLVTSCGIANISWSSDFENGVIKTPYKQKVTPLEGADPMDDEAAAAKYFEDVAKNPMIFVDDWMSTWYTMIAEDWPEPPTPVNEEVKVRGSGKISISLSKVDGNRVSGRIDIKGKQEQVQEDDDSTSTWTTDMAERLTFKNVPFAFEYDDAAAAKFWTCYPDISVLPEDDKWEVTLKGNEEIARKEDDGSTQKTKYVIDLKVNKNQLDGRLVTMLLFTSFYFDNVEPE